MSTSDMTMTPKTTMTIEVVPINDLRPDPANPRRIGEAELEALTRSIREFGLVQPLLVRRADHVVVGGHQRLTAARKLGLKSVPVVYLDLTVEQSHLLNLALNKISGEWDSDLLAHLLADLNSAPELDLTLSGFGEDELAALLKSLDHREKRERPESFDLVQALEEARAQPVTQRGQLWALGDHRLLCGDATRETDLALLLGDRRAALCVTDPPYGVDLGNHGGQPARGKKRTIANDALPPEEWLGFCRGWAMQLLQHTDGACYIFMSTKEWPTMSAVLGEAGGHWSDSIIWRKDRFVLGRADYQRSFEPIWYGWREGASHHWCGDWDQEDVWSFDRPSKSPLHPTMKPLPLLERCIENSSKPGALVLDLFLGSGSCLIASERTGRICYGMEVDPTYCDVIIARWQAFTGEQAALAQEDAG